MRREAIGVWTPAATTGHVGLVRKVREDRIRVTISFFASEQTLSTHWIHTEEGRIKVV